MKECILAEHEVWADVPGYAGLYEVSNFGRIRSLTRTTTQRNNGKYRVHTYSGTILSLSEDENGYLRAHVSKNGKDETMLMHRIVASVFCEPKPGCDIVNHLDCNPSNNRADNLEWTTYKGNMQYASSLGRMQYNVKNLKKAQESKKIPVVAIKDGDRKVYPSSSDAARELGLCSGGHIAAACRKEYGYKTVGGYEWEYADPALQGKQKAQREPIPMEARIELLRKRMRGNTIMLGRKLSEETKKKLSKINARPVIQLSKGGDVINEFPSASVAKCITGISHIDDCASGKRKSAGGFYWKWKGGV